jgi:hypothetical protein
VRLVVCVSTLLSFAACSVDTSAVLEDPADDGAEPSAGEGGLPVVADVGVDGEGDGFDAEPDAVDADAAAVDSGARDSNAPDVEPADTGDACIPVSETCNAVDEDCDGQIDEDTSCPCDRYTHDGSTYLICLGTDSWSGSRDLCRSVGYELVTIDSAAEDDWLWTTIGPMTGEEVWIGLTDAVEEGTFLWPDGTIQRTPSGDLTYSGWRSTAPDNNGEEDCVELDRGSGGEWEDVDCSQNQVSICEAP